MVLRIAPELTNGEEEVLAELRRIVRDELELDRAIEPTAELIADLGLDSLAALSLVVALEDRFRVVLDDLDADRIRTVLDLVRLVEIRRADPGSRPFRAVPPK